MTPENSFVVTESTVTQIASANRSRLGVTLIELVVVLAMISALIGAGAMSFLSWLEGQNIKTSARAVSNAFMLARGEAMRSGQNHIVAFGNGVLPNVANDIVIARDGAPETADCSFVSSDVVHSVDLLDGVAWGTTPTLAGNSWAPADPGLAKGNVANGTSFTTPNLATPASWVTFEPDGIPRAFTSDGSSCTALGLPGEAGGGIYLTNGERDYAVLLAPLGTARVLSWRPDTGVWVD